MKGTEALFLFPLIYKREAARDKMGITPTWSRAVDEAEARERLADLNGQIARALNMLMPLAEEKGRNVFESITAAGVDMSSFKWSPEMKMFIEQARAEHVAKMGGK